MVWKIEQVTDLFFPLADSPDGKKRIAHLKITREVAPNSWQGRVCQLVSRIGDISTAGRRRSWFFEGLYSKTTIGWIGYVLLKDLLLYGRHQKRTSFQYRVTNCPIWEHRGCHQVRTFRYEF